jgi:hypothetical protein
LCSASLSSAACRTRRAIPYNVSIYRIAQYIVRHLPKRDPPAWLQIRSSCHQGSVTTCYHGTTGYRHYRGQQTGRWSWAFGMWNTVHAPCSTTSRMVLPDDLR